MGLSRNKVAVPEGVAGTPPFWSSLLDTLLAVRATRLVASGLPVLIFSLLSYTVSSSCECAFEFIDNTERDNEVKKLKRDYSLYYLNSSFFELQ